MDAKSSNVLEESNNMNYSDWEHCFPGRSLHEAVAHPDSPAGGTGPGFSRPPGPQNGSGLSSRIPHLDSPAGRTFDWQSELFRAECQERNELARRIEEVEVYLATQSSLLKGTLPDNSLRSTYECHLSRIGGSHRSGRFRGDSVSYLVTLLEQLQSAVDCLNTEFHNASHRRVGFDIAIQKVKRLWDYGTPQDRRALLSDIEELGAIVYDEARVSVQEQWSKAVLTGRMRELIQTWVEHFKSIGAKVFAGVGEPEEVEPVPIPTNKVPKREKLHWIEIRVIALPDVYPRNIWWPRDRKVTYANEPFTAEITDGHRDGALDHDGCASYYQIPGGTCSLRFTELFHRIETALKPGR